MGQIHQNAEAKTEIRPPSTERVLYSDKARFFNQSERVLYRNFIIKLNKYRDSELNITDYTHELCYLTQLNVKQLNS